MAPPMRATIAVGLLAGALLLLGACEEMMTTDDPKTETPTPETPDPAPPQTEESNLSISDATVVEGNRSSTNATFTVTLSAASTAQVTVSYATSDGTAVAGSDYTAQSGTLTFSPDETSKAIEVAVIGDTVDESDETFTVTLSNPTNATFSDATGTATIQNDDASAPQPPESQTGSVSVTSDPAGAQIILDGNEINQVTPYTIPDVALGDHTISLTLDRYQDWGPRTVTVTADRVASVSATLTLDPASNRPGIDWTETSDLPATFYAIAWNRTRFVAVGNRIAYSGDGINWTFAANDPSINTLQAIVWNGTRFVAVGNTTFGATKANIVYSSDGINWTLATTPPDTGNHLNDIAWNGTRFVAVGYSEYSRSRATDHYVLYSNDGISWAKATLPNYPGGSSVFSIGWFRAVSWNGTRFVAVDEQDRIAYSSDGINWTWATYDYDDNRTTNGLDAIMWSGTRFVAVGARCSGRGCVSAIVYSSDGIRWSEATMPISSDTTHLQGIAWNGTRFVSVGWDGRILYSSDGSASSWTEIASPTPDDLEAITWSGTRFVAVGHGSIVYSDDGISWTKAIDAIASYDRLNAVLWTGARFIAVGGVLVHSP